MGGVERTLLDGSDRLGAAVEDIGPGRGLHHHLPHVTNMTIAAALTRVAN
jgi:hypothetical protein